MYNSLLLVTYLPTQDDMLLEYDIESNSPIGLVSKVPDGCEVLLTDATGGRATAADGSDVAGITIASPHTGPQVRGGTGCTGQGGRRWEMGSRCHRTSRVEQAEGVGAGEGHVATAPPVHAFAFPLPFDMPSKLPT